MRGNGGEGVARRDGGVQCEYQVVGKNVKIEFIFDVKFTWMENKCQKWRIVIFMFMLSFRL